LQYLHLLQKSWLFDGLINTIKTEKESKTFAEKNYDIEYWHQRLVIFSQKISA